MILFSTRDTEISLLLNQEIPEQFLSTAELKGVTPVGDWQSFDVSDKPQGQTIELQNAIFEYDIPKDRIELAKEIEPNMPFAEAQFEDRVSGQPLNPPPSFDLWPWRARGEEHQDKDAKFSHTYPERFWPKYAFMPRAQEGRLFSDGPASVKPLEGIRYNYGDLNDLVQLLTRSPATRQAYLPVFFPEDTGAVQEQRIPCTLGYHFLMRQGAHPDQQVLHCTYFIRSCDFLRHFRDDVYMASRLCQWVCAQLWNSDDSPHQSDTLQPGQLHMHICSFHIFEGDLPMMRRRLEA